MRYSDFYHKRKTAKVMGDINVTPFIDVMLVLLVVFMISAPLLVSGVNINLPEHGSADNIEADNPFTLTINEKGEIFYEKTKIDIKKIGSFVKQNLLSKNSRVYIRGDQDINYGKVISIMSKINEAGYKKVSLVTEKEK